MDEKVFMDWLAKQPDDATVWKRDEPVHKEGFSYTPTWCALERCFDITMHGTMRYHRKGEDSQEAPTWAKRVAQATTNRAMTMGQLKKRLAQ